MLKLHIKGISLFFVNSLIVCNKNEKTTVIQCSAVAFSGDEQKIKM